MALIYPLGLGSGDFADGWSGNAWQPQNYLYGSHIVIPSSGTVTQLGVYARRLAGSNGDLKFGLYTSGGSLVAQSTAVASSFSLVWVDSGAISGSVSAGTYYVLVSSSIADIGYGYDDNPANAGSYATEAYATAMQASETISGQAETGQLYGVRLDFTAGGGGAASFVPSSPAARLNAILLPNF